MTFICDVRGLRLKIWKEMSTFFSIFFSKLKNLLHNLKKKKFQPITTFTINASPKKKIKIESLEGNATFTPISFFKKLNY
jgi:hypothetical protein